MNRGRNVLALPYRVQQACPCGFNGFEDARPMNAPLLRPATADDAAAMAAIYNHYVEHTVITFEEEAVSAAEMATRLAKVTGAQLPWLLSEEHGTVLGYAYASPWHARSAYRYSVESTVYLDPRHTRRGLGTALYTALFTLLRARGLHCVIGGISLPNAASIALHEKLGMRKVAHYSEVGFKFGEWVDVGYWQAVLA
jgi:phosphinothricin acetyltransferase